MALPCPYCNKLVNEDDVECPYCNLELDPFGTIQLPSFRGKIPGKAAGPVKPQRAERPSPPPELDRAPPPAAPRRPKPRPAAPEAPPLVAPSPPPQPPVYQAPPPKPVYQAPPPPVYQAPPPPVARAPVGPPPQPPGPVHPQPQPQTPTHPAPAGGAWKGLVHKFQKILGSPAEAAVAPAYPPAGQDGWPAPAAEAWNPPPPIPVRGPELSPLVEAALREQMLASDDEPMTQAMPGIDISKLRFPTSTFAVQIRDKDNQWRHWAAIGGNGLNLGRSSSNANFPFLNSMAVRHLRLGYDGPRLVAEDLGSLNGVYLQVTRPTPLVDGSRFRIGSQVIEFREAGPSEPVAAILSGEGEEFLSHDFGPVAHLDLIRPDNSPGLRFPLTNPEATKIGRGPKAVDIALDRVEFVSAVHGQVRRENGRYLLEDLGSRNGTFLRITGPTQVHSGDVLLVGRAFLRIVEQPT